MRQYLLCKLSRRHAQFFGDSHHAVGLIVTKVEIAGPGFINIFLDPAFLADNVNRALQSERLGAMPLRSR
jgi:arginyl-tRNA synthetase